MNRISLLYHDVISADDFTSSGFPGADANIYKLEQSEFEQHLDAIRGTSRPVIVIETFQAALPWGVLLTFDDGGASSYRTIADLLERRGWRGTFFITTDYIGQPSFMTAPQIRDLRRRGHVIGSHSCSHPARMASCSWADMQREWNESTAELSEILGEAVGIASVPGGYFSKRVAAAAAGAGIKVLFNSEPITRAAEVDGCRVLGRYSIQRGVTAASAGRIAAGDWSPRMRQYCYWNAKKGLKSIGGSYWLALRREFLARRFEAK